MNNTSIYSMAFLSVFLCAIFYFMMPQNYDENEAPLSEFSTNRALTKVKAMTLQPHFVGSENHEIVAQYLLKELEILGLKPEFQEGFTMTEKGTLVKSKNIIAKIKGSNSQKSLLLLSHYDSAPHSFSKGASDDASGIATILESVRAFLHAKTKHKNDIIIVFSDAEELGLNGAALFVTQHNWAKEVGLALNFEARGSSGPSYMLMETTEGNAKMVEAFSKADVQFPTSNSLMYSIYKMLPNDTDLTIFREKGDVQGFNFAFIDNHFNYHTMHDTYENLSPKSLAHQGSYLFPLLNYFSNADLTTLKSADDNVYFTIPFTFLNYSFSWIFPMLIVAFLLLILFIFVGLGKQLLRLDGIIKGFLPLFGALFVSGITTYIGWKLLCVFYPEYNQILQGFTYNGHDYIYAFVSVTMAICFLFYRNNGKRNPEMNQSIAPLFLWILINLGVAIKLQGAAFFIIPVISSILILGYFVLTQKSSWLINCILSVPAFLILAPFVQMFPIGLGLKILFGSSILTVLIFTLLLPVFGSFAKKKLWAACFFLIAVGFFVKAHLHSDFSNSNPKPNSLLYVLDADTNQANWTTYDNKPDEWTKKYLGENPKKATELNSNKLYSKYGSEFTFMANAPKISVEKPSIEFVKDSVVGKNRYLRIMISPNRKVNRYDIFSNTRINNLKANEVKSIEVESNIIAKNTNKIVSYYVVNNEPLTLEFSIKATDKLDMNLVESSFDLLSNPLFKIEKRKNWMIATPFVLNDAVVIKQKIKPSKIIVQTPVSVTGTKNQIENVATKDSLK